MASLPVYDEFAMFCKSGNCQASQSARGPLLYSNEMCVCLNVAHGSVYCL